jgi:hypothetical protein
VAGKRKADSTEPAFLFPFYVLSFVFNRLATQGVQKYPIPYRYAGPLVRCCMSEKPRGRRTQKAIGMRLAPL